VPDESQQQAVSKAEPQPLDVDQPNTRWQTTFNKRIYTYLLGTRMPSI
jgi:hypothetical protein